MYSVVEPYSSHWLTGTDKSKMFINSNIDLFQKVYVLDSYLLQMACMYVSMN